MKIRENNYWEYEHIAKFPDGYEIRKYTYSPVKDYKHVSYNDQYYIICLCGRITPPEKYFCSVCSHHIPEKVRITYDLIHI